MADRPGLLEKESVAFASSGKCKPKARQRHLKPGRLATKGVKLPEMDELLEHTLVNKAVSNTDIAKSLTRRETEILRWIVSGKTNKEMAHLLCRTERTVEYHRNRLIRKLKAHNIADLVKRAISMRIT